MLISPRVALAHGIWSDIKHGSGAESGGTAGDRGRVRAVPGRGVLFGDTGARAVDGGCGAGDRYVAGIAGGEVGMGSDIDQRHARTRESLF